ncbi:MAG: lysophospholipid acyltransferase family protein [Chloroflexota bacterium]
MQPDIEQFPYPRLVWRRRILRAVASPIFDFLTDLEIIGAENLPKSGPFLIVANHFHFMDPVVLLRMLPWSTEFLGGFHMPDAPTYATWIPKLWGIYTVRRGSVSRTAFRATAAVFAQDGIVGIFPEAGSWAPVLKPARPGAALLAVQSGVPVLPIGLDGVTNILSRLKTREKPTVTVKVGKMVGPFKTTTKGKARRKELDDIGDEIMHHIAALIPPQYHGVYSSDPTLREAAEAVADYPYHELYKEGAS